MASWSHLPYDLWHQIGKKLRLTADQIRFRSVCKTWRSLLPFPQPPWLMLAEDEQTPSTRGFFGLGRQQLTSDGMKDSEDVYQFDLPEVYHTRCLGSMGTWLITIDLQGRIRMLNPFSKTQIDLPSQDTLEYGPEKEDYDQEPEIIRDGFIWKVILSSPPTSSSKDCVAITLHQCNRRLAIARPGDASWKTVQTTELKFVDAIFYKGQFYAINIRGVLVAVNLSDDQSPPVANTLTNIFKEKNERHKLYLVEWKGELLLVIKFMRYDNEADPKSYHFDKIEMYIFDFTNQTWNELKNLGEYCMFLGFNTSIAVLAAQYPGLKRNCIYYTDDYMFGYRGLQIPGGYEMGVFDLEDKSIRQHYKGVSTSLYSPPLWIIPKADAPPVTEVGGRVRN